MKKSNTVLSILLFLLAGFVGIMWMPQPTGILTDLTESGVVLLVIKKVIFFLIYGTVLIRSVFSIIRPGKKLPKRLLFIAILTVFGIQLVTDLILLFCRLPILSDHYMICADILTAVRFFVFVCVCIRIVRGTKVNKGRFFLISGVLLAIVLTVFVALDIKALNEYRVTIEKYQINIWGLMDTELTDPAASYASNYRFNWEVRNALLSSIVSTFVIAALGISTPKFETDEESKHSVITKFLSRCWVAFEATIAVCVLVVLLIPYNSVTVSHFGGGVRSKKGPNYSGFEYDIEDISHSMGTGYGTDREVYHVTNYVLRHYKAGVGTEELLRFSFDGKSDHISFEYFVLDGKKVNVLGNTVAVCYDEESDTPVWIDTRDLSEVGYDETLIAACKMFLEDGRISCFENVAPYLLKYEPDLIKPYIERYSEMDLTPEEVEQLEGLKPEYIARVASELAE